MSLGRCRCNDVVYYESLKRDLKTKPINECRCDERLKTRVEESTLLACPRLVHFVRFFFVYYESIKRELNKRLIFDSRCDARLKAKTEGCTHLEYTMCREEP